MISTKGKIGICRNCGIKFVKTGIHHDYCTVKCRNDYYYETQRRKKEKKKSEVAAKKHKKTLMDLQKEAAEHGMSYGKYVAMIESGASC